MGYKYPIEYLIDSKVLASFLTEANKTELEDLPDKIVDFSKNNFSNLSGKMLRKKLMSELIFSYLRRSKTSITSLSCVTGIDRAQLEDYLSKRNEPNKKNNTILLNVMELSNDEIYMYRFLETFKGHIDVQKVLLGLFVDYVFSKLDLDIYDIESITKSIFR